MEARHSDCATKPLCGPQNITLWAAGLTDLLYRIDVFLIRKCSRLDLKMPVLSLIGDFRYIE